MDSNAAGDWAFQLCEDKGHRVVGHYGDFRQNRIKNQRLNKTIKFAHPPSVQGFDAIAREASTWEFDGYTVNYEPSQNAIFPNNAATIATTGVSSVDPTGLVAELWGFVYEYVEELQIVADPPYLLDDDMVVFGKFFVVSCSTLDLAHYICSKTPIVGTPYELVYELNDRGLLPAERARDMESKRNRDVQEGRDTASSAAYQMVKDQKSALASLGDRIDRNERQHALDRREDSENLALIFCVSQETADLTLKGISAETDIRTSRDTRDKYETELRTVLNTIDDYLDDDTDKGRRKLERANKSKAELETKILNETAVLKKAEAARDALRVYESPWKQKLFGRLGNALDALTSGTNPAISSSSSTTALIEASIDPDDENPVKKRRSDAEKEPESIEVDVRHSSPLSPSSSNMDIDVRSQRIITSLFSVHQKANSHSEIDRLNTLPLAPLSSLPYLVPVYSLSRSLQVPPSLYLVPADAIRLLTSLRLDNFLIT